MVYSVLLVSIAFVAYTWTVYPLLLLALRSLCPRPILPDGVAELPLVSIIVPVHNEQEKISAKLENCRALRYPDDRLEIIVASDGSRDGTEEIVRGFQARDARLR